MIGRQVLRVLERLQTSQCMKYSPSGSSTFSGYATFDSHWDRGDALRREETTVVAAAADPDEGHRTPRPVRHPRVHGPVRRRGIAGMIRLD